MDYQLIPQLSYYILQETECESALFLMALFTKSKLMADKIKAEQDEDFYEYVYTNSQKYEINMLVIVILCNLSQDMPKWGGISFNLKSKLGKILEQLNSENTFDEFLLYMLIEAVLNILSIKESTSGVLLCFNS
jgi:hypothetical protein